MADYENRNKTSKYEADGTPRDMHPAMKQHFRDRLREIYQQRDAQYAKLCKTINTADLTGADREFMQYVKYAYHNAIDLTVGQKNKILELQNEHPPTKVEVKITPDYEWQ